MRPVGECFQILSGLRLWLVLVSIPDDCFAFLDAFITVHAVYSLTLKIARIIDRIYPADVSECEPICHVDTCCGRVDGNDSRSYVRVVAKLLHLGQMLGLDGDV